MKSERNKKTKAKSEMVVEVFDKRDNYKKLFRVIKAEESRTKENG